MDANEIKPQNKSDRNFFIIALCFFIIAMFNASNAFMIGIFGIPSAVFICILRMFDTAKRNRAMKWFRYGGCVLLLIAGPSGCKFTDFRVEYTMAPFIAQLEEYKKTHGRYPEKIEELGMGAPKCPNPHLSPYFVDRDSGENYSLMCVTFVFNHHSYSSKDKKWRNWD